ncbi:hypothetical protein IL306_013775, partial [Fusarium sp. DS 682]
GATISSQSQTADPASTPFETEIGASTLSTDNPDSILTTDPTTTPTEPGSDNELVIFRIVLDTDDSRRRRLKRALGGFVGSSSELCQEASSFSLSEGYLLDDGRPIYYDGKDFKELRGVAGPLPSGAIATTFAGDGGFLRFRNPDVPSGEAGFCQTPGTVNECEDGETSSSTDFTSTDLPTVRFSTGTDSVVTSLPFSTASPVIPDNPSEVTSLVDFTTVTPPSLDPTLGLTLDPSLEPTQARPEKTSSFRFYNTSSLAFPTAPIETSDDLPFTNIPGVTFTQSQLPSDEASSRFVDSTTSDDPAFTILPSTSGNVAESLESTTADVLPTDILSTQSQLSSDGESSSVAEAITSTALETHTTILEPSIRSSDAGTISESEVASTTVESQSESTTDITIDVSTTTTTSPPSRACESILVNPTVLFSGDEDWDDEVQALNLPWPVGIYTESNDTIFVGFNGLISLNDARATESSNNPFPDNSLPLATIAAYWDNLRIDANAGYGITYNIYDDADSRYRAVNLDWCVVGGR